MTASEPAARPLVVVGDVLLDAEITGDVSRVCPDAPVPVVAQIDETERPGGAGLAAALAAAGDPSRPVVLVTAIARDAAGERLRHLVAASGVELVDLGAQGTTAQKVRVRSGGQSLLRIDRGGDATVGAGPVPGQLPSLLRRSAAILVSDYGRGLTDLDDIRRALAAAAPKVAVVWDPHPRGSSPIPGCLVATPNLDEARRLTGTDHIDLRVHHAADRAARRLLERWSIRAVAVTLGARGALLADGGGAPMVVPAAEATGDTCGAGDSFAAAVASTLADGGLLSEAVVSGVETASRFVAAGALPTGGGSAVSGEAGHLGADHPVPARVEAARRRGCTIVATGGCFDLLHAGHVRLLEQARSLGQYLVVCLNSDESVRRAKGAGRPVNAQDDRRRLLEALGCVDAVAVFDEDTPEQILRQLRPDVFVKGGDYTGTELPEEAVVASWGGHLVTLPYLAGHSTTDLLDQVGRSVPAGPAPGRP